MFSGRRGDLIKVLCHDGLGMSRTAQLGYLLEGIDWRHPQRTYRPEAVG